MLVNKRILIAALVLVVGQAFAVVAQNPGGEERKPSKPIRHFVVTSAQSLAPMLTNSDRLIRLHEFGKIPPICAATPPYSVNSALSALVGDHPLQPGAFLLQEAPGLTLP